MHKLSVENVTKSIWVYDNITDGNVNNVSKSIWVYDNLTDGNVNTVSKYFDWFYITYNVNAMKIILYNLYITNAQAKSIRAGVYLCAVACSPSEKEKLIKRMRTQFVKHSNDRGRNMGMD